MSGDFVSRDYLIGEYDRQHQGPPGGARRIIAEAPAADVVEVRHGRWIVKTVNTFEMAYGSTGYEPVYECSLCGGVEESYLRFDEPIMPDDADFPNYCPNCGAKMDGGQDDV